jgi:ankyrin repeat protein
MVVERKLSMRVVRGLVVVAVLTGASACNRPAGGTSTRPSSTKHSDGAEVQTGRPENPTDELYQALRITPDEKKVRQLLDEHPDWVNQQIHNVRPLWIACESRSLSLVQALVERGADFKANNEKGQTSLWAAVTYDSLPVVQYLVQKGADPKALQEDGQTLLWAASTREMAEYLMSVGVDPKTKDINGDLALHQACRHSLLDVVKVLLDHGVDIEAKGHWDMRPLQSAASTATGDPRPVVNLLLKRGADLDSHGFKGQTALHECALYNRLEMADLLLTRGAQPNLKDDDGKTPIDVANLAGRNDRIPLINLLIKHGAPGVLIPLPLN